MAQLSVSPCADCASEILLTLSEIRDFYDLKIKVSQDGHVTIRKYEKNICLTDPDSVSASDQDDDLPLVRKLDVPTTSNFLKSLRFDNLSRSRNLLIDLAYSNFDKWHSFITLTFAENITDISFANREFNKWVSQIKRVYPDFVYLCVPEFQKRGAVHYHLISSLVCGIDLPALPVKKTYNTEKKRTFELIYYDLPFWKNGFSTAFDLHLTDNRFDVAAYMCKYMFKDIDKRLFAHQKIMHSNGLRLPDVYRVGSGSPDLDDLLADFAVKYKIIGFEFKPQEKFQIGFQQQSFKLDMNDLYKFQIFLNQKKCNILEENI